MPSNFRCALAWNLEGVNVKSSKNQKLRLFLVMYLLIVNFYSRLIEKGFLDNKKNMFVSSIPPCKLIISNAVTSTCATILPKERHACIPGHGTYFQ